MDFFAVRAMDVARLSEEQLKALQVAERESGSCRFPYEHFEELVSIKTAYGAAAFSSLRVRNWSRKCVEQILNLPDLERLRPLFRTVLPMNVSVVHSFDWTVHASARAGELEFRPGHRPKKRAVTPTVAEGQDVRGGRGRLLQTDLRTAAAEGYSE